MRMNIQNSYITVNQYSRPKIAIKAVKGVVIHWVGNPNSSAEANRNYFDGLKVGKKNSNGSMTYASAHYIIGLDGEVVACIPENEMAYHASSANGTHLGIEVCHKDWEGQFTTSTYETLVELIADICRRYELNPLTDIIRHYDVTGKNCPKYYVLHNEAWIQLKNDVNKRLKKGDITQITIQLNGKEKQVSAINIEETHYIKLRDLADDHIDIRYDKEKKIPVVTIK